jgi:hypothetical protein
MSDTDYIEPAAIADVYADGICDVELLGANVRLIFYTWSQGERIVVAKVVQPLSVAGADVQEMVTRKRHTPPVAASVQ